MLLTVSCFSEYSHKKNTKKNLKTLAVVDIQYRA